jgi:hypothetical protein
MFNHTPKPCNLNIGESMARNLTYSETNARRQTVLTANAHRTSARLP